MIWMKKWLNMTNFYLQNLQANHRGNDVIVLDGKDQVITTRFMYGSFDVTSLSGEKVNISIQ
jgi:hypothetical protein